MLPDDIFTSIRTDIAKELGVDTTLSSACEALVVTGSNASGKSFLRRFITHSLRDFGIECIHLSQEGRGQEGIMRAFVYGDEGWRSTGSISAHTFEGGFATSHKREKSHVLLWDEPEIGMGPELQLGTAIWVREQMESNRPKNLAGLVVLTHSSYFVKELIKLPSSLFVSLDGYKTPSAWMKRKVKPVDPVSFGKFAIEKFRRLTKLLEKKNED